MPTKRFAYDWTQFTEKIEIDASVDQVFRAWTDDTEITKWFVSEAEIEPKKGGRFYMAFLTGTAAEEKVLGIRKNRFFSFTFGPDGETVEVTFKKTKMGSECHLHQFGMKNTEKSRVEWHMGCRNGWVFFLTNLKAVLEHGVDLRSRNAKKSYKEGYVNS